MINENGLILWENTNIVVIVTGIKKPSENKATGDMLQVFILYKGEKPALATKSGKDKHVCGNCPRRPIIVKLRKSRGEKALRPCYVELNKSVRAVWEAWDRGAYAVWNNDVSPFVGRVVRWGAYGGPEKIPVGIVRRISEASDGWTGYTHQWWNPAVRKYRKYLMASTDSRAEHREAKRLGWASFRVLDDGEGFVRGESMCEKSKEHKEVHGYTNNCASCLRCNGRSGDVGIKEHN